MIRGFRHRGLKELFEKGTTARIDSRMHRRIVRRLDRLDAATEPEDMNLPGFDFHRLRGKPRRYTVHVNGPWCFTFQWDADEEGPDRVDLEQHH